MALSALWPAIGLPLSLLCAACTASSDPEGSQGQQCADPSLRGERAYDEIVIDGQGETDRRFWGGGIVAGDFDRDGDLDLIAPGPHSARYLRNDGGIWTDDVQALPARDWSFAAGGAAADYDEDGDLDVIITAWGPPSVLLRNEPSPDGGVHFVDEELPFPPAFSQSASWRDVNGDGHLDVLVAGHGAIDPGFVIDIDEPGSPSLLLMGDGTGRFQNATGLWLDRYALGSYTYVAGWTDLNGDDKPDLLFGNDYPSWSPSFPAIHEGERFRSNPAELGLTLYDAGMGLAVDDINGDQVDDFLMPVWDKVLVMTSLAGRWVDSGGALGIKVPEHAGGMQWVGWGAEWADLDNDGDQDAIVAFGRLDVVVQYTAGGGSSARNDENQRFAVYLRDGESFTEAAYDLELARIGAWRGFATADLNEDGWLDLARRDLNGPIVLNLSRCGSEAWLKVAPEPPHLAVGARVLVRAGARTWSRHLHAGGTSVNSGNPPEVHFGLGALDEVDEIEVRWPDGEVSALGPTHTRQAVTISR